MELTHTFTVPTSVDDAWALFMDLEQVGGCFPGATVTEVSDDSFSGTVKVKLGPIALLYTGSGSFVERDDAAHHAVIEAKGKDKRGNGTAGATVTIQLTSAEGGTRADVVTDLAVTGKPAQFGRGVMQDVSDKLLQQFVACIEKQLTGPKATPETEGATEGAPQGTAAETAAETAATAPAAAAAVASAPSSGYVETGSDALAADTSSAAPSAAPASQVASAPRRVTREVEEEALDLGSAVMPVLIQRYAGYAAAAAIGALIGWLLGRRGD
ncbi:SRPBCC family protein [Terrabacter sp. BE26]|uniref:SRPBCC family protein n=1 Tax=Terrabacter sp. BE26 TaxID=2898152 RepID=UPI0035BE1BA7